MKTCDISREVRNSCDRLGATIAAVNQVVIGRKDILDQVVLALMTGHHLLLEGSPGIAKSFMTDLIFGSIEGCETFKIQCTKKMTEDSLVGPPNVRILREEGRFEHNIEGTLVTAHFGFLDEIMDLSAGALRALLEILNERTFSRGRQRVKSRLMTAIATTNFNRDSEEELAAVLDRFLFRAKVVPLANSKERLRMLTAPKASSIPKCHLDDIRRVRRAVRAVVIPESVLRTYLDMCADLSLTDRRVVQGCDVIRAAAVLAGRTVARIADLPRIQACFCTVNDRRSESAFAKAMSTLQPVLQVQQNRQHLVLLVSRAAELRAALRLCTSYGEAQPLAEELATVGSVAEGLKHPGTQDLFANVAKAVEEGLTVADVLYAESQAK